MASSVDSGASTPNSAEPGAQPVRIRAIAVLLSERLRRTKSSLYVAILGALLVGAAAANAPALITGWALDVVIAGDATSFWGVLPFLAALLFAVGLREGASAVRKLGVERVASTIERDELVRLNGFLLKLDLSAFTGERIGGLNLKLHRSLEGLVRLLKLLLLDLAPTLMAAMVAFAIVMSKSLLVSAVVGVVFTAAVFITAWQVTTQRGIRASLFRIKEEVSANLSEVLAGIDYVRAVGGVKWEEKRVKALSVQLGGQEFRHHKAMISFDAAKQFLEGGGLVAVLALSCWQLAQGNLTGGEVLALSILYGSVSAPLRDLHRIIDEGFESLQQVQQLHDLYRLRLDPGLPGSVPVASLISGLSVQAVEVRFAATDDKGQRVVLIDNLTFAIRPGEWVGVAGRSGCGKSTLAKAILGILPDYEGRLEVAGVEVRDADKEQLWSLTGYVGQHSYIVKGSVRDNLLYADPDRDRSDADLLAALRAVGLTERFGETPAALDREIAEAGHQLSGGEKQRLSIARLFLRRPKLLILDEATSALDYALEADLIKQLRQRFGDCAAIVIAHRHEALRQTDRIMVLKAGRKIEEGTFSNLLARGGEFTRVANASGSMMV